MGFVSSLLYVFPLLLDSEGTLAKLFTFHIPHALNHSIEHARYLRFILEIQCNQKTRCEGIAHLAFKGCGFKSHTYN